MPTNVLQNEQGSDVVKINKDNKESLNKRLLQELYLVRNILDPSDFDRTHFSHPRFEIV